MGRRGQRPQPPATLPFSRASKPRPPAPEQVKDGYVWGRGAIDDKQAVLGHLEAVEDLLKHGHVPTRTVYLGFGARLGHLTAVITA